MRPCMYGVAEEINAVAGHARFNEQATISVTTPRARYGSLAVTRAGSGSEVERASARVVIGDRGPIEPRSIPCAVCAAHGERSSGSFKKSPRRRASRIRGDLGPRLARPLRAVPPGWKMICTEGPARDVYRRIDPLQPGIFTSTSSSDSGSTVSFAGAECVSRVASARAHQLGATASRGTCAIDRASCLDGAAKLLDLGLHTARPSSAWLRLSPYRIPF